MDLNIILALITLLLLIIIGLALYKYPLNIGADNKAKQEPPNEQGDGRIPPRNQRARMRANAARQRQNMALHEDDNQDGDQPMDDEPERHGLQSEGKIGAKKRAKLEAKAEKKAAREVEEQLREERKAKEAQKEEERKKSEDKEKADEIKRLEEEKREIEEREQREQEEYLKMKAAFAIEGEGFDEEENDESERNLLQEFIAYIKANKVVIIEDLASHFKLKTQAAIDRIAALQSEGKLTGVVDDRGKFIYISQQELENVAKFIKQRGRVSITDLVESSNQLINLVPVTQN